MRHFPRLATERLEDRTTPATTFTWTGAVSASWADPGNWLGNDAPTGLPGTDEILSFPATPVRLTSTNDLPGGVSGFTRIDIAGANYVIGGNAIVLFGTTAVTAAAGAGGSTLDLPIGIGGAGLDHAFDIQATGAGLTVTGVVSGAGGANLVKVGAGTLTLQGANTYPGTTTVSAGTLRARTSPTALGSTAGGTVVAAGARLEVADLTGPTAEPVHLGGSGPDGGGALLNPSGNNQFTGNVFLDSSTTIGVAAGAGLTLTGQVDAVPTADLTKVGAGTLTLEAANTYDGTTTVSAGTLRARFSASALGGTAGGTVVDAGARLEVADLVAPLPEPIDLDGTLASTSGSNFLAGSVLLNNFGAVLDVTGSFLGVTGSLFGLGDLLKTGPDTLGLYAANGYGGGTVIRAGAVDWFDPSSFGTGPVRLGDALSSAGTSPFLRAAAGGTLANPITVVQPGAVVGTLGGAPAAAYSGTLTLALPEGETVFLQAGSAGGTTFTGRITGTGDVAAWSPDAPGRVITLDNGTAQPNDFTRATTGALAVVLPEAVLRVVVGSGKEQLPDDVTVLFASANAALELAGVGATETVGALASNPAGSGVVRAGSAGDFTLGLNPGADVSEFSGRLLDGTGTLSVTKSGAGTLTLTGQITIGGPLTVADGPLVLAGPVANGAASPDVVVSGTGTLSGVGPVAGSVSVAPGGRFAPGDVNGQGVLPTGALTFQPGATYGVNATVAGGVTTYGRAAVTGGVNLGGAALALGTPVGAAVPPGVSGVILDNDGSDAVVGTFAGLAEGAIVTVGGAGYRISYVGGDGNDVTLTTTIPLVLAPDGVPGGLVGTAYSTQLSATGAAGPFTFAVASGTLPPGLTLSAAGLLAGTPTAAGSFSFTVGAANSIGDTGSRNYTITIGAGPAGGAGRPVAVTGAPDGSVRLVTPAGLGLGVSPFGNTGTPARAAVGDVNGDGTADVVAVTGPGVPLRVTVLSGTDASVLVAPFDPFGGNFTGGGYVAAGDLDGDGRAEFVVTPDQGGGPRVSVFGRNTDGSTIPRANFLGIDDANFRGGARAALGDVNGDGVPDVVVAAGFGGGPRTAIFTGQSLLAGAPARLVGDFFAFPGSDAVNLRNGSFVAAGDVTGDGFADLVFGGGPGGAPRVFILSGALVSAGQVDAAQAAPVANFFVASDLTDRGGARVAVTNRDGDGRADVAVGSGAGRPARVRVYLGKDFAGGGEPAATELDVFGGAALSDGVYVG